MDRGSTQFPCHFHGAGIKICWDLLSFKIFHFSIVGPIQFLESGKRPPSIKVKKSLLTR